MCFVLGANSLYIAFGVVDVRPDKKNESEIAPPGSCTPCVTNGLAKLKVRALAGNCKRDCRSGRLRGFLTFFRRRSVNPCEHLAERIEMQLALPAPFTRVWVARRPHAVLVAAGFSCRAGARPAVIAFKHRNRDRLWYVMVPVHDIHCVSGEVNRQEQRGTAPDRSQEEEHGARLL